MRTTYCVETRDMFAGLVIAWWKLIDWVSALDFPRIENWDNFKKAFFHCKSNSCELSMGHGKRSVELSKDVFLSDVRPPVVILFFV